MGIPCVETTEFASCTQFSLLNSLQLLHLGVIVQDQIFVEQSPSTLSPCLGGDKAKFPGWQTSNFFTRLKTLGAGGGGLCGL